MPQYVIDTLKPKNNNNFPVAEAVDVLYEEGSTVKDKIIAINALIVAAQQLIEGIQTDISELQSGKVDKVSGKGLSTNDFTNTYKNKVDNTYTKTETDSAITTKIAEVVASAPEDLNTLKEIADWIDTHADSASAMNSAIQANAVNIEKKVDKVEGKTLSSNDFTDVYKNKVDNTYTKTETDTALAGKVDKVSGKGLSTNDFTNTYKSKVDNTYTKTETDSAIAGKIAEVVAEAPESFDTLKEIADWIDTHADSASAMNSAIQANTTNIEKKVDKVEGKILSTNDFTDTYKNKVENTYTKLVSLLDAKEKIFLSAFFDENESLNFYTSENLIDYEKINVSTGRKIRDASLLEYNGVIYIAYTGGDEESDFNILSSSDLENFSFTKVDLGLDKSRNRWAPSLSIIDDQVYLTITSRSTTDAYIYMCEYNLADNTYTNLKKLELDCENLIDSELFEWKSVYYLLAKDETTKKTHLYKSTDLSTFTFVRLMNEFPAGKNKSEGAFPLKLGDMLFIGVDNYDSPTYSRSLQLGYFYSNIEATQQGNGIILNTQNYICRHGSTIQLSSSNLIIAAEKKMISHCGYIKRYQTQELKYYATDGIIDELYVFPDVVYVISGSEQYTINKLYNPFGCENFMLQFRANVGDAWVEIVNNGSRDINCKIINSNLTNEKIIEFKWTNFGFYLCNHYEPPLRWVQKLSAGSNNVAPVMNNEVYAIEEDGDYTVNVNPKMANDLYVHTGDEIRTGTLTFDGNVIDLSTLPAKYLIHFVKYGTRYFPTGIANFTRDNVINALGYTPIAENDYFSQSGGKNILNFKDMTVAASGSITYDKSEDEISVKSSGAWSSVAYKLPPMITGKQYTLTFKIANFSKEGGVVKVRIASQSNGQSMIADKDIAENGSFSLTFTATSQTQYLLFYPNYSSTAYVNEFTCSELMLRYKGVGDDTYVAYVPTNKELYEMIKNISNQNEV